MKADATFYKGIEFVSVNSLPADQQLLLKHTKEPGRIKILADGKILSNCIEYKKYTKWYSNVYQQSVSETVPAIQENLIPAMPLVKV